MMKEYKQIPGLNYRVSSDGIVSAMHGAIRQHYTDRNGYINIKLCVDGKMRTKLIHRLVYEAWAGPIPKGIWINHKDGVKSNNDISNLELTTPSENHLHAFRVLNRNRRQMDPKRKELIKTLHASGLTQRAIATELGISQPRVSLLLKSIANATT